MSNQLKDPALRTYRWNQARGHTSFKFSFEMRLLSEEIAEGYKAAEQGNLVELVDALCDAQFVYTGSSYKFGLIEFKDMAEPSSVRTHIDKFNLLT